MRPALRYHGQKWKLYEWISSFFPPHTCYCEPYGGGAGILLQKPPSPYEVYNDLGDVALFFQTLREQPDALADLIRNTPYSRFEYLHAMRGAHEFQGLKPIEAARRFLVQSWQSRGTTAGSNNNTGWRYEREAGRGGGTVISDWLAVPANIIQIADRLRSVQIEHSDAIDCIQRYDAPGTLFYVDPPYVWTTRNPRRAGKVYQYEMADVDHRALADTLSHIKGVAIVSGYPSDLYAEIYTGWRMETRQVTTDHPDKMATECLWIHPRISEMKYGQRDLFLN